MNKGNNKLPNSEQSNKGSINSDGQLFNQYQQRRTIASHLNSLNSKKDHDI